VLVPRRGEGRDHVVAADPPEHRAPEQVAGVVVEPADDLDPAPVRQAPVGEVGLPGSVGGRGLEPDPGAARALVRLGHDEARGMEDPADGGHRGDRQPLARQVPGDRGGPGVEAAGREPRPERHDPVAQRVGHRVGARVRPPRAGLEAVEARLPVPGEEPLEVAAAEMALSRGGGDGQLT